MNFRASWVSSSNLSSKYNKCHSHVGEIWTVNSAGLVTHNAADAIKVGRILTELELILILNYCKKTHSRQARCNVLTVLRVFFLRREFDSVFTGRERRWQIVAQHHPTTSLATSSTRNRSSPDTLRQKTELTFCRGFALFKKPFISPRPRSQLEAEDRESKKTDFKAKPDNTHCRRNNTEGQLPDHKTVDTSPHKMAPVPELWPHFKGYDVILTPSPLKLKHTLWIKLDRVWKCFRFEF